MKNLVGKKSYMLTVIELDYIKKSRYYWKCLCDCGNIVTVREDHIFDGDTKSCGCYTIHRMKNLNTKDIKNKKFNMLTALKRIKTPLARQTQWECQCECGNYVIVATSNLLNGTIKSCGCYRSPQKRNKSREEVYKKLIVNSWRNVVPRRKNNESRLITLSDDEIWNLTQSNCFYCGCKPSNRRYYRHDHIFVYWNGIDRLDSNLGYVNGNVVPSCKRCNVAKNDMTTDEFKDWLTKAYNKTILNKEIL